MHHPLSPSLSSKTQPTLTSVFGRRAVEDTGRAGWAIMKAYGKLHGLKMASRADMICEKLKFAEEALMTQKKEVDPRGQGGSGVVHTKRRRIR